MVTLTSHAFKPAEKIAHSVLVSARFAGMAFTGIINAVHADGSTRFHGPS